MSSSPYATLPAGGTLDITPFKASVSTQEIDELKTLLRLAKFPPPTYEGSQTDRRFGVPTEWVRSSVAHWATTFDWRAHETHINSFPHFTARVPDGSSQTMLHFVALFSTRADAIPLLFLHGWPGSFLEFLPILDILRTRYTPDTLPYHVVVPSLPGYTFSGGPPIDRDFSTIDATRLIHELATGLGFSAYAVQAGDIGSSIARALANTYNECKAIHLNMVFILDPPKQDPAQLTEAERTGLERSAAFFAGGFAYAQEHATRPATISAVISSSPVALLAWIGEKYLDLTDVDLPIETVLESVSLYWFTQTFPRAIYPYREAFQESVVPRPTLTFVEKPLGFSYFPKESIPTPRSWVATAGNLVYFREHTTGGHFAALEQPEALLHDVEEFVAQVWPGVKE